MIKKLLITIKESVVDEIIDELREANLPVPMPLELPEEDILVEIEEQLFVSLGTDFREFLLTVSDVVYGSLEPVTVVDSQSHTYLLEVAANAWDQGVSRELVPICEVPGGYYCIDEKGLVSLWLNGETQHQTWDSIWYWSRDVWLES